MHPIPLNTDLLSGALLHLGRTLDEGCPRSSAIAALLFNCLGEDASLGEPLCRACRALAESLDGQNFVVNGAHAATELRIR
jgi:hypothetical protein